MLGYQGWPLVVVFCRPEALSGFCGSSQVCFPLVNIFSCCFLFCLRCLRFVCIFLSTKSALVFVPGFFALHCCCAVLQFLCFSCASPFAVRSFCVDMMIVCLYAFFLCVFASPPSIYMPISCVDVYVCGSVFDLFAVLVLLCWFLVSPFASFTSFYWAF